MTENQEGSAAESEKSKLTLSCAMRKMQHDADDGMVLKLNMCRIITHATA
ncbi:MAG: hypothetical protein GY861_28250 [bacterium]|nr:hypothetical protein [bacterium]